MLYKLPGCDATATPTVITGRNLAHAKRSITERAFVGAGLHLGHIELASPTIKQAARLAGVCVPYVAAAVAIGDDPAAREAALIGDCNILEAAKSVDAPESLVAHFARTTPAEWLECARTIGPAIVWDRMIAPLI